MRQWMVDPAILCKKHLLGEHSELHMFASNIKKKIKMDGYIINNLLEPLSLNARHDLIADEMKKRGFKHKSELIQITDDDLDYIGKSKYAKIDVAKSYEEILRRCQDCRKRYSEILQQEYYY